MPLAGMNRPQPQQSILSFAPAGKKEEQKKEESEEEEDPKEEKKEDPKAKK